MTVAPISVRADHVRIRPARRRAHPAWIQALPHYDPDYDYQWEHYIYESDFTTDPGYLVENVKMPQGEAQEKFEDSKQLVAAFVRYRNLFVDQSCRVIGDRLIRHLDQWLTTTYGTHNRSGSSCQNVCRPILLSGLRLCPCRLLTLIRLWRWDYLAW